MPPGRRDRRRAVREGQARRPLVSRWRTAVFASDEAPSVKLTLLALAEYANPEGTRCFPSIETLAQQTGQGEKTCRRALEAAEGHWFTRTAMPPMRIPDFHMSSVSQAQ